MAIAKASARKSLGEYKPLIKYQDGSTEVCEQSAERQGHHTKQGFIPGNRMARGTTYPNREDAIAAAQFVIDARLAEAKERYAKYEASAPEHLKEKLLAHIRNEIKTWGGN